ncbi:LiaF transmembrane domain-containing protein [Pedobacter sp. JCM 36344]|uniref:LiaF transmembrane domain-containing protein n=1 Tax=Pedobacter sp. JCM 36344 TaxID=3374280 RepID=UPI00397DFFD4
MKLDRIMWGIVLLFIGSVLLLENFNVIEFYWGSVWRFWPIFLIIAGVNILFSKSKSQVGGYISIGVLVVMLGVLFYRGTQVPQSEKEKNFSMEFDNDDDGGDVKMQSFDLPFDDAAGKKTVLNISGGGTSYTLEGETDSLFTAAVKNKGAAFSLMNNLQDSLRTVTFKMNNKKNWNMGEGGNDVNIHLNTKPIWEMHLNMGAGEINFDLSPYQVREFNFDGGAAALDIKFGDILPIADVRIKTGVADVKLSVPTNSGCRITTKSGLSSKDFEGFIKLKDGIYETSNYSTSTKKIFISLNGGLSNFEVKRY